MDFEEHEHNGHKYIIDHSSSVRRVIIDHDKEIPKSIYKYYSISDHNINALVKQYFYASHPIEINDALDSTPLILYASKPLEFKLYKKLYGDVLSENELKSLYDKDCNEKNKCSGYVNTMYNLSFNLVGIISTTTKKNDPLMWPHYTQEKGFQIKFNTKELEESIKSKLTEDEEYLGLFPINYTERITPIDICKFRNLFIPIFLC